MKKKIFFNTANSLFASKEAFWSILYVPEPYFTKKSSFAIDFAFFSKGRVHDKKIFSKWLKNFFISRGALFMSKEVFRSIFYQPGAYFGKYLSFAIDFAFFLRGGYMKKKIFF